MKERVLYVSKLSRKMRKVKQAGGVGARVGCREVSTQLYSARHFERCSRNVMIS